MNFGYKHSTGQKPPRFCPWAKTASFLFKIGATDLEWCPCGKLQTVPYIINSCPLLGAASGSQGINLLDLTTRAWLESQPPL